MLSQPGLINANPPGSASSSHENYVQPNLSYGLRIWWAYYWPTFLISSLIIGVLMVVLRRAWENVLVSGCFFIWANRILPYAVMSVVSILGIYRILTKKFRSFYIVLMPRDSISGAEPLPRTSQRTLRVWWAFIWRNIVYSVVFKFAGSLALGVIIGFLTAIAGPMGAVVSFVSQVLIDAAVGSFVIYSGLLDEEFGDFRVTLVPRVATAALSTAPAIEPTAPNPVP